MTRLTCPLSRIITFLSFSCRRKASADVRPATLLHYLCVDETGRRLLAEPEAEDTPAFSLREDARIPYEDSNIVSSTQPTARIVQITQQDALMQVISNRSGDC